MRKRLIYCAVALMVAGLYLKAAPSLAYEDPKKEVTITGEVIDEPCYVGKNGARGEGHKNCALACAKRGNQMAIVDDANTIYSITGDYAANKNEKLIPFVAQAVEATGVVTEKDGKKTIAVTSIKKVEMK
ncbi:MAG TPA: hypothetical protein VKA70_17365 [Blastocatellia bacterium]|nr:hypothetical protein [Blastocatellia bacterium]